MFRFILLLAVAFPQIAALNVAVYGATGRVGQLVVQTLLEKGHAVSAVVRDTEKAASVLPRKVKCTELDLASATPKAVRAACEGTDAAIWCASGFTEAGESIDMRGMQALPGAFLPSDEAEEAAAPSKPSKAEDLLTDGLAFVKVIGDIVKNGPSEPTPRAARASSGEPVVEASGEPVPKLVMLSSAGVSRPAWKKAKKERLVGAADIPIIRLNPGGILDKKAKAEQMLRDSGVPYTIVRPTGLKFEDWPQGRPVISQGDVAVGRTNPTDLAEILVDVLEEPASVGKTFELFTLAGYPAPRSLAPALERIKADTAKVDEAAVDATYDALQQLLPGEEQDATKLEMGRTYEQVDTGAVAARSRGAAPTEREQRMADGVAAAGGPGRKRDAVKKLLRLK